MADATDFKAVADILTPLFNDLTTLSESDSPASLQASTSVNSAVTRLNSLLENPTDGSPDMDQQRADRSNAALAIRGSLIELGIQASTHSVSLTPSQELIRSALLDSLKEKISEIAVIAALAPLSTILTKPDMKLVAAQLQGASIEIAQRQQAKLLLDTTVDVAIAAGKIAMMFA